jgi:glycosyltransferase involved in cell wall biosynthesis
LLGLQQELQVPLVHTEHSSALVAAEPMSQAARQRVRSVLQAASTVFAVGPALKNALAEIEPLANIVVLGNPVPINEPFDRVLREPGRLKVASAGNLIPHKRADLQLDVIGELCRVAPHLDVNFTIAGSGPDEPVLRRRAGDAAVEFVGELERADLLRLMAESDVFLHTSISETFGVVLVEALYQGTPVVAMRCGGVTDMAGDLPGLTVVEQDAGPRVTATAIVEAFESKPDRWIIRSEASQRFGPAIVREQLRHHYLAALGDANIRH